MKNRSTFLFVHFKLIAAILILACQAQKINAQGNALNFDGTDDYIVIGTPTGFYTAGQPYTKEAWVLSDAYYTPRNIISSVDPFYIEANNKVYASNDYVITP